MSAPAAKKGGDSCSRTHGTRHQPPGWAVAHPNRPASDSPDGPGREDKNFFSQRSTSPARSGCPNRGHSAPPGRPDLVLFETMTVVARFQSLAVPLQFGSKVGGAADRSDDAASPDAASPDGTAAGCQVPQASSAASSGTSAAASPAPGTSAAASPQLPQAPPAPTTPTRTSCQTQQHRHCHRRPAAAAAAPTRTSGQTEQHRHCHGPAAAAAPTRTSGQKTEQHRHCHRPAAAPTRTSGQTEQQQHHRPKSCLRPPLRRHHLQVQPCPTQTDPIATSSSPWASAAAGAAPAAAAAAAARSLRSWRLGRSLSLRCFFSFFVFPMAARARKAKSKV